MTNMYHQMLYEPDNVPYERTYDSDTVPDDPVPPQEFGPSFGNNPDPVAPPINPRGTKKCGIVVLGTSLTPLQNPIDLTVEEEFNIGAQIEVLPTVHYRNPEFMRILHFPGLPPPDSDRWMRWMSKLVSEGIQIFLAVTNMNSVHSRSQVGKRYDVSLHSEKNRGISF